MASIAMMIGGAVVNALAFSGSSFLFSQMRGRQHELAMEKLQQERDLWNEERLQRIDYINKKLKEQGHAAQTFNNVEEAMQEYYMLTGDDLPPLSAQPRLEDFLNDGQNLALQRGELALISLGIFITGYLTYKFI